jgi:ankyrin repeat protein
MYHIDDAGIVGCLLERRADVNETSSRGETPLYFASSPAVVKLILSWRPNLNGQTASDKARQARRNELGRLIGEHYQDDEQSRIETPSDSHL